MAKQKSIFTLLLVALSIFVLQSCDKDDDAADLKPGKTPEITLHFSEISHREFRMWTNGQELNTSGFAIEDYLPAETAYQLSSEYYISNSELTFRNDSLFSYDNGDLQGFPYTLSNDSIYIHVTWPSDFGEPNVFTILFGIGDTQELYVPQSFFRYAEHYEGGGYSILSLEDTGYFTPEWISEEYDLYDNTNEILEGDTLIIINQRISFK